MLCITTFALSLQSPAPLSRRAVFSGAAAAAVPLAAKAFDLPALEEFDGEFTEERRRSHD